MRVPTGGGLQIPWLPLAVVAGIAAVVGLVVYLVIQAGQPAGESGALKAEADDSIDLPGEYINLPEIYGGPYSATAGHLSQAVDYSAQGLPPAGGRHWAGRCADDPEDSPPFCGPAPWGVYRTPWDAETLVHNMEHAGTILWYNTTDQGLIEELEDLIEGRLKRGELLVMAPYPDIEEEHIALTAWSRRDLFPVSDYSRARVEEFLNVHERRFNPEGF